MKQYMVLIDLARYIILIFTSFFFVSNADKVIYSASDPVEYDREYLISNFSSDLDSNFLLFPETISGEASEVRYSAAIKEGFFDNIGTVILDCTYPEEIYDLEIDRISSLYITIRNHDGLEYTNHVMYDKNSYPEPAYITIDGFADSYEYALVDEAENRIIYIYMNYPDTEKVVYAKYLKKDTDAYNDSNTLDNWSMYNHSFDGGKTWIEITDNE